MAEDTALRFSLVHRLMGMRYGRSVVIDRSDVQKAWPPTGDHDNSDLGVFRAMALAAGGNRPEDSYTTEERISNDLDKSFTWDMQPWDGNYVFHRKVSACPKCKGQGSYQAYDETVSPLFDLSASVPMDETITVKTVTCDHSP